MTADCIVVDTGVESSGRRLCCGNGLKSSDDTMAKAFTYSRLPEHQVAVYYDGSDKAGVIFKRMKAFSQISA